MAAKGTPLRAVTGHFDPLLVEHSRLLRDFARPGSTLVVVVTANRDPLLSLRARAELVAALSVVDYVFAAEDGRADAILAALAPEAVLRCEQDDQRRTAELIAHVQSRY